MRTLDRVAGEALKDDVCPRKCEDIDRGIGREDDFDAMLDCEDVD